MKYQIDIQTKKVSKWINTKTYLILHHTGSQNTNFTRQTEYLANNKAKVSCHYVVWQGGEIAKIASDDNITWHAWVSKRDGKTWMNKYALGIETVSNWTDFSDRQRDSVMQLVKYLMNKHSISCENVIRHKDVAPWRKTDVWDNFRSNRYATYTEYQKSLIKNHNLKMNRLLSKVLPLILKILSKLWGVSKDKYEKDELHNLAESIRRFQVFYK